MAGHYCSKHQTVFFKKGKMKNYAHPIEGTDPVEWCNEPEGGGDPEPEATIQPTPSDMSKGDWAEKDRITRASIESQKRADIIANLWIAGKIKDDDLLVKQMRSWLAFSPEAIDQDIKTRLAPDEKKEAKEQESTNDFDLPDFEDNDAGKSNLVNFATKHGWKWDDIRTALSINNPTEIKDVPAAVAILFPDKVKGE